MTESLSDYENNALFDRVGALEISPQHGGYSRVEIIVDENTTFPSGDYTGRVLTIQNAWGTQEQADNILASIIGFRYQPYEASGALLSPAAELGDAVTANGIYSGIHKISRNYTPLMSADIAAPHDEEIDHEYPYETKQDREYKRAIADANARLSLTSEAIESEITRATEAEGTLASAITQTATDIRASVLSKEGGSSSSFGWTLTDSAWTVQSNGTNVLTVDSGGLSVKGTITATSGFIGDGANGFTIRQNSIFNGMESLYSSSNGVYIGTEGIALGGGNFRVTSSGTVSANNMTLTGTLTVGGNRISASNLYTGAAQAYGGYGTWNGTSTAWGNATTYGTTSYPGYLTCGTLTIKNGINNQGSYSNGNNVTIDRNGLWIAGSRAYWAYATFVNGITPTTRYSQTLGTNYVQGLSWTTGTIVYLTH